LKTLVVYLESINKYTLMYWIHEYYLSQWSTIMSFFISLHNIEDFFKHMHLNTFFEMQVQKIHVTVLQNWVTSTWKYDIKIIILSSWQKPMCVDMVLTFHYLVIIYQSFNVKVFWKFWKTNQFRTYFSSIFLI